MRTTLTILCALIGVTPLQAQAPATGPAGEGPAATQPAEQALQARVVQLSGKAQTSAFNAAGEAGDWKPIKVGDVLSGGSQIRTQLRSRVVLAFGDDTVVVIERMTKASIDQFYRTADTKRVKLGLGHGTVRAGVAETTLRSDMTIETPTATLSKRGTMDFGISYEPSTGRFRVFLNEEGLVEVLKNTTHQTALVRPGQYVTEAMQAWIDTLTEDRWVPVVDTLGLTDAERAFNMIQESGLAVVEPGAGGNMLTIGSRDLAQLASRGRSGLPFTPLVTPRSGAQVVPRPEGNFGTGSGSISLLFKGAR